MKVKVVLSVLTLLSLVLCIAVRTCAGFCFAPGIPCEWYASHHGTTTRCNSLSRIIVRLPTFVLRSLPALSQL